MNKHLLITALMASLLLSGCNTMSNVGSTLKGWLGKRDNGSLDYQAAKKLAPIELPQGQVTAEFTPLYPTPAVGENTLNVVNESGKQYRLPAPPQVAK